MYDYRIDSSLYIFSFTRQRALERAIYIEHAVDAFILVCCVVLNLGWNFESDQKPKPTPKNVNRKRENEKIEIFLLIKLTY